MIKKLLFASALLSAPALVHAQQFGFVSLEVADMERAKSFYIHALGMKPVYTISKPTDEAQKVAYNFSGNASANEPMVILIHHAKPSPDQNRSIGTKIGFRVADSRASAARVRSAGYKVDREPDAAAKGPVLTTVVHDPDGVVVELVEVRSPG